VKLVASAIVRNEADRYLETWLRHLLTFCDEVRLLDDGSEDGTRNLAESLGTEVQVRRNPAAPFLVHEADARNALLRWTIEGQPDYVLSIDADEFVGEAEKLREYITGGAPVYSLWMREVWKIEDAKLGLRVDGQWGDRRCPVLWKAPPVLRGNRWLIPRRKLACGREPQVVRGQRGVDTGVGIYHFGWTREADRQGRAERYFEHDGGRYHANSHIQSILWPDKRVQLKWVPWPFSIPSSVAEDALAA
jgi:glycosyltransferase involved in cell wall biosynthesis